MNDALVITELTDFTLVHVATRGNADVIAQLLSAELGINITAKPGPVAHGSGGLRVLWFGPGRWLIHAPGRGWMLEEIPGSAVTDLSDGKRIFRWRGEETVRRLEQSCPLDLHVTAMPIGSSAMTQFDRFSILLYRIDTSEFDLYVDRSYGESLPGAV